MDFAKSRRFRVLIRFSIFSLDSFSSVDLKAMESNKPDRAMELLRAHLLSKFDIPPSDLSPDEIFSRQGWAEADNLTAQESGFKKVCSRESFR